MEIGVIVTDLRPTKDRELRRKEKNDKYFSDCREKEKKKNQHFADAEAYIWQDVAMQTGLGLEWWKD